MDYSRILSETFNGPFHSTVWGAAQGSLRNCHCKGCRVFSSHFYVRSGRSGCWERDAHLWETGNLSAVMEMLFFIFRFPPFRRWFRCRGNQGHCCGNFTLRLKGRWSRYEAFDGSVFQFQLMENFEENVKTPPLLLNATIRWFPRFFSILHPGIILTHTRLMEMMTTRFRFSMWIGLNMGWGQDACVQVAPRISDSGVFKVQ